MSKNARTGEFGGLMFWSFFCTVVAASAFALDAAIGTDLGFPTAANERILVDGEAAAGAYREWNKFNGVYGRGF